MEITQKKFGMLDNDEVTIFTLRNAYGMEVSCINYGCIITEILVPDKVGNVENVVLGFESLEEYIEHSPFFGAICGRVAGRIGNAEFRLNNKIYPLVKNDGKNHLHGGAAGFDKVLWEAHAVKRHDGIAVEFSRVSPDGEEGYPGNLEMKVTYLLTDNNELIITYHGVSDEDTLVNVTNHSYFNLSGNLKHDILNHELQIKSSKYAELAEDLIPTGTLLEVDGTPFDFQQSRQLKEVIQLNHPQVALVGNGLDHPFLLDVNKNQEIVLQDDISGRMLIVETNEPCVVVYTSNMLPNDFEIRGVRARKHLGICLETQGFPDAVHHPNFPQTVLLRKGEAYSRQTKYSFQTLHH